MLNVFCVQTGEESLRPLPVTPKEIEDGDSVDQEKHPKQMESTAAQSSKQNAELEVASHKNRPIPALRNNNLMFSTKTSVKRNSAAISYSTYAYYAQERQYSAVFSLYIFNRTGT